MAKLTSKIFIDGGEPEKTREANEILKKSLGRPLDGQTTNPTLIAKNLKAKMTMKTSDLTAGGASEGIPSGASSRGGHFEAQLGTRERQDPQIKMKKSAKLTPNLALAEYQRIVQEMSKIIPSGSISIQVFANLETKAEEMIVQARERHGWIPNSSIKLPATKEGLKAAKQVCQEFPINITLVFSQSQAAAVYEATKNAKYPVFISPFVGRLDDQRENGMQVVANILKMYKEGDGHVEVLTASVRNLDHIFYALQLKSNIITIPFKVFKEWSDLGFPKPQDTSGVAGKREARAMTPPTVEEGEKRYVYPSQNLKPIPYREDIKLGRPFESYDLYHALTDKGIAAFWTDWSSLFT